MSSNKRKKRKRERQEEEEEEKNGERTNSDTSLDQPCTISIALPGSIINNAQTLQLKTNLAGQVARTAAIFRVNEVIVFNEESSLIHQSSVDVPSSRDDPNTFLCRILQYMETPQYLRKALYGVHSDLKFAGLLNPLDAPHHMRAHEVTEYREGVVLEKTGDANDGSIVDCGLTKNVQIDKVLDPGVRVTVQLKNPSKPCKHHYKGTVVAPSVPLTTAGIYWGYTVRYANTFGQIFTHSSYKEGYDLIIGTSERGDSIDEIKSLLPTKAKHCLIVFGGQNGLEYSLKQDKNLKMDSVESLCHFYLNTCPKQGSRTIRTEEAILISLSIMRPLIC